MHRPKIEIITRMMQLSANNYNCSQIMMLLTLERAGHDNADLVRAMSGLGDGCGFFNETCGVMTGAASALAWYGGKGAAHEAESDKLLPMLQELGDWFQQQTTVKYRGSRCKDIVGDRVGTKTGKLLCGRLIFDAHNKVNELLSSYGFSAQ